MTDRKLTLELIGTLGDVRTRNLAAEEDMACADQTAGIDPCSSAGLD